MGRGKWAGGQSAGGEWGVVSGFVGGEWGVVSGLVVSGAW